MRLPADGVEFAKFTVTTDTALTAAPDIGFTPSGGPTTWRASVFADSNTGALTRAVAVLVAGPAAVSPDPAALVLARGEYRTAVRVVNSPEVVIREGGRLTVG